MRGSTARCGSCGGAAGRARPAPAAWASSRVGLRRLRTKSASSATVPPGVGATTRRSCRGDLPRRLLHLHWFGELSFAGGWVTHLFSFVYTGEALASLSVGWPCEPAGLTCSLHFALARKQPAPQHLVHRRWWSFSPLSFFCR